MESRDEMQAFIRSRPAELARAFVEEDAGVERSVHAQLRQLLEQRQYAAIANGPVVGTLKLLPFEALEFEWPDFESLLWRVLRDVEGLRDTQVYGLPGQTQLGLDLVALAADGSGTRNRVDPSST